MKIKVMYFSKTGNTKKVAEAIAQELNAPIENIPPAYMPEKLDLMFIGAGIYGGNVDKKVREFISFLNIDRVKNVALFGTSGGQDTAISIMRTLLKEQGINVLDESYICKGKFFVFFNRKNPNEAELKNAREFAKKICNQLEN